jgi:predicted phage terminase large subunit-like protein
MTYVKPEALEALERRLLDVHGRRQIRKSFEAWCRHKLSDKDQAPAKHHLLIINEVEKFLEDPDLDVLLFHAPPGSAKSTYISHLLPPWYLARYPQNNVLFATHSGDFAARWGRKVRSEITNETDVLGIGINPQNAASDQFSIVEGGEYYSVGAGVGISGFRADLGLFDDLFGNREDAWSDTIRQKRWDWFTDDFGARLKPKAKRIGINTRWHETDVAGRLVEQIEKGHIRGRVVDIPAIAGDGDPVGRKPGDYLWDEPDGYDYSRFLRDRQRETSPMMWAALFQQRPAPEDGDYFKAEWLRPYTTPPDLATLRTYIGCDFAVTADGGDYSVICVVGVDPEGRMFLLDLWRRQASSDEWVEKLCDMILQWKPQAIAQETGQIRAGIGPFLTRRMRERRAYAYTEVFPTRGDKSVRAQSIRGRMALEGLHVPTGAPWYPAFRSELLSFPAGRHDDIVDAIGLVGQLLDRMLSGEKPQVPEPPGTASGYAPFVAPSRLDDWMAW